MQADSVRNRRMLSEINVTPLVDVVLVLLIIFRVTTPMLQRGTDVQLPTARVSGVKEEERITLTVTRDNRIYVNDQQVSRDNLEPRLRALAASCKGGGLYFCGGA